jgi:GrpB-like predicted nucleotidyltransferase (UPF0157 family)
MRIKIRAPCFDCATTRLNLIPMSHPLIIEPHRECWKDDYEREAVQIREAFGPALLGVHHIGSTAIPGIPAKPVIDMLAEFESLEAADAHAEEMKRLGYEVMGEFGIAGRRYYRKNDSAGRRTHQVHGFVAGSPHITRHLAFRDYLRDHPGTALEYGVLKLRLWSIFQGDLEAYINGKEAFVQEVERRALQWAAD